MEDTQKPYGNLKIKTKDSEADIQGEIAWELLEAHRADILEELRQEFEAPGFRKGRVPMEVFLKHVREDHVLEDAAERALQEVYPLLIEGEQLRTLGRPEVAITKLAAGNPLGFRIQVGLVPEVKLPDYKKISKEVLAAEKPVEVSPEEVQKLIDELRELRRGRKPEATQGEAGANAEPLPELTDDFVKTLGDFASVEDFRTKLAENLKIEKGVAVQRERREKLADALSAKAKMILPAAILEAEANAMQERLQEDLQRANITFEDYLSKIKKTSEELRSEHRNYVERQLRTRFILDAIAQAENLSPDPQELAAQIRYLEAQHGDTDPKSLERYATELLRNERVLRFLEGENVEGATEAPEQSQS